VSVLYNHKRHQVASWVVVLMLCVPVFVFGLAWVYAQKKINGQGPEGEESLESGPELGSVLKTQT